MFPLNIRTNNEIEITPSVVNSIAGNLIRTVIPNSELEKLFYNIWEEVGSERLKNWIEAEGCIFVDNEMNNE